MKMEMRLKNFWQIQWPLFGKVFFVYLAFSLYYTFYLFSFDQGVSGAGVSTNILKLASIIFLFSSFRIKDLRLNTFDILFMWTIGILASSYIFSSLVYEFSDRLFVNFLVFALAYPFMLQRKSDNDIYLTYNLITVLMCIQVLVDLVLRYIFKTSLWNEGVQVGGLGNPSSYAFVCFFSIVYLLFGKHSFNQKLKLSMLGLLLLGVVSSSALFVILLTGVVCALSLYRNGTLSQKISLSIFLITSAIVSTFFVIRRGGLLANKLKSLFEFLVFSNTDKSDSVSLRVENVRLFLEMIKGSDLRFLFGGFREMNYFSVDSQYITFFLSFGLLGLMAFILFLIVMLWRIALVRRLNKKFLSLSIFAFVLIFFNNRILDYYPVGYIFVSLMALLSTEKENDDLKNYI